VLITAGIDDCASECERTPLCQLFSFWTENRVCRLYSSCEKLFIDSRFDVYSMLAETSTFTLTSTTETSTLTLTSTTEMSTFTLTSTAETSTLTLTSTMVGVGGAVTAEGNAAGGGSGRLLLGSDTSSQKAFFRGNVPISRGMAAVEGDAGVEAAIAVKMFAFPVVAIAISCGVLLAM